MMFAADRMLGKLANWLRLLGYDTLYSNTLSDDSFLALADGGRVLITRNTRLVGKAEEGRLVFVHHNDPEAQLQEVIQGLGLKPDPGRFFSRCTLCNGPLASVEAVEVFGLVPDYVWTAHDRFFKCGGCHKIYWPGSHLERSREKIRRLLEL